MDGCETCHLALPLLVPLVFADHPNDTTSANDLALVTYLFDRSPDLHRTLPIARIIPKYLYKSLICPPHALDSTNGPSSVMATECSKWAERLPSLVTAVHPSSLTSTSCPPALTIGSLATTRPADSRRPFPASP